MAVKTWIILVLAIVVIVAVGYGIWLLWYTSHQVPTTSLPPLRVQSLVPFARAIALL